MHPNGMADDKSRKFSGFQNLTLCRIVRNTEGGMGMEDQKLREWIARIAALYELDRDTAEELLRRILRILTKEDPAEESS